MKICSCLACGSEELIPVLSFPKMPLTDRYMDILQDAESLRSYPLDAYFCSDCTHLQLGFQVDPKESYTEYIYQSGVTPGLTDKFNSYAREVISMLAKESANGSLQILDVGSNDGSFIQSLRLLGLSAYGVEPARSLSRMCNENSLPTLNSFFDEAIIDLLDKEGFPTRYDLISFNNVLANVPRPLEALLIAKRLLRDSNSRISIQTGYHPLQFSRGLFDYIYHEHYSYFSLHSMRALASRAGLKISAFQKLDLRGGSARFYLSQSESEELDMTRERFDSISDYKALNTLIGASSASLKNALIDYKRDGLTIIGFGASHSTGTLIHSFQLSGLLDMVVDDNSLKHGKYVPGTSLRVFPSDVALKDNSVIVVLAWQYFDLIAEKLRRRGFEGPVLRPVLP